MHRELPALILGSASPYRRELLERLRIPFSVKVADIDETPKPGEPAEDMVKRLAREKADAILSDTRDGLVITSDQCAVLHDEILGKPGDMERAFEQLAACSGKEVVFFTSLSVIDAHSHVRLEAVDTTIVRFRELEEDEIRRYIEREQPLNCAGSFKVEGLGITLFDSIENRDPTALVGLPMIRLARMLREFGYPCP